MGKGSIYHIAKGDSLLQSKHADVGFKSTEDSGWALFWFDGTGKGKCVCVEYNPANWPEVYVTIQANWKARRQIARYEREGALWEKGVF